MNRLNTLATALIALVYGCNPVPAPAPVPTPIDASDAAPGPIIVDASVFVLDAAPATVCELACSALAAAGCAEGAHPKCAEDMTYLDSTHRMARPDGKAITCAAVATVKLPADAVREGVGCTLKAGATGANIADAGHDGR